MTYDPNKVEDWVVASSGFWRKGEVNTDRWTVPFTGTWEQAKNRMVEMTAMQHRHAAERATLEGRQRIELQTLWPEA